MTTSAPDPAPGPVDAFLDAVTRATIPETDAWTPDAVVDATVPNWRFSVRGADAIRAEFAQWFRDPGRFESLERTPLPDGELVEYVLAWEEDGVPHAVHHLHRLRLDNDRIVAHTVFCGGRWPAALLAQMEEAGASS
jgi:hypothetical protein